MTFIREPNLYPLKMYLQTKSELPGSRLSKVIYYTYRYTDGQMRPNITTAVVIISDYSTYFNRNGQLYLFI